jgi:hypothetical protein
VTDPAFFEVSAQVIPLLMVVGLIEHRGTSAPEAEGSPRHRLPRGERDLAITRLGVMLAVVLGEVAALTAVAGYPTPLEDMVVRAGLAGAALFVIDRFLDDEFDRLVRTMRVPMRLVVILTFLVVAVAAVAAPFFVALVP